MTKSLQDRVYLKGKPFGFKMIESKFIEENLDEFNRLVLDLENIEIQVHDEDKAIIVLNSIPKSFSVFVDTMKYAKETLVFDEIQKTLKAEESLNIIKKYSKDIGDSFHVRERSDRREVHTKNCGRSKSKTKKLRCFLCDKQGHFRKDCPDRYKQGNKAKDQGETFVAQEGYDSAEVLCVADYKKYHHWVLAVVVHFT